jgi:hypothetical protein
MAPGNIARSDGRRTICEIKRLAYEITLRFTPFLLIDQTTVACLQLLDVLNIAELFYASAGYDSFPITIWLIQSLMTTFPVRSDPSFYPRHAETIFAGEAYS